MTTAQHIITSALDTPIADLIGADVNFKTIMGWGDDVPCVTVRDLLDPQHSPLTLKPRFLSILRAIEDGEHPVDQDYDYLKSSLGSDIGFMKMNMGGINERADNTQKREEEIYTEALEVKVDAYIRENFPYLADNRAEHDAYIDKFKALMEDARDKSLDIDYPTDEELAAIRAKHIRIDETTAAYYRPNLTIAEHVRGAIIAAEKAPAPGRRASARNIIRQALDTPLTELYHDQSFQQMLGLRDSERYTTVRDVIFSTSLPVLQDERARTILSGAYQGKNARQPALAHVKQVLGEEAAIFKSWVARTSDESPEAKSDQTAEVDRKALELLVSRYINKRYPDLMTRMKDFGSLDRDEKEKLTLEFKALMQRHTREAQAGEIDVGTVTQQDRALAQNARDQLDGLHSRQARALLPVIDHVQMAAYRAEKEAGRRPGI